MQNTDDLNGCKNDNFQMISYLIIFLFLPKTYILGTHLNRLIEAVLTSTHNLYLEEKMENNVNPL